MDTNSQTINRSGHWKALNSPFVLLVTGFICTTVLGGLLTFTLNRLANKRDIRFEAQLKALSLEQELRLKADAKEKEFLFVSLHVDRAAKIKSMYEQLIDIEKGLFNLLYKWRPIGIAPENVKPENVVESVRNFKKDVDKSKIYFTPELSSVLEEVCRAMDSTLRPMENAILSRGYTSSGKEKPPEFGEDAWEGVHIKMLTAKERLISEFRELLGVK